MGFMPDEVRYLISTGLIFFNAFFLYPSCITLINLSRDRPKNFSVIEGETIKAPGTALLLMGFRRLKSRGPKNDLICFTTSANSSFVFEWLIKIIRAPLARNNSSFSLDGNSASESSRIALSFMSIFFKASSEPSPANINGVDTVPPLSELP